MLEPKTLGVGEVLQIHQVVIADFAGSGDPVFPHGVKSHALLESAVNRQHSGSGSWLKYADPLANAATLAFGICCDHPFHNGNKRTALVAMLVHLDRNRYGLYDTKESDLYRLMLGIADHSLGFRPDPRRPDQERPRKSADEEVEDIRQWLKPRAKRVTTGERPIPIRRLRQILARFGFSLEETDSNQADVVKYLSSRSLLRFGKVTEKRVRYCQIGCRSAGTEVSIKDIKYVRSACSLTEEDGVDTDAFYDDEAVIDTFVNRYRGVLRRLAKT